MALSPHQEWEPGLWGNCAFLECAERCKDSIWEFCLISCRCGTAAVSLVTPSLSWVGGRVVGRKMAVEVTGNKCDNFGPCFCPEGKCCFSELGQPYSPLMNPWGSRIVICPGMHLTEISTLNTVYSTTHVTIRFTASFVKTEVEGGGQNPHSWKMTVQCAWDESRLENMTLVPVM
jgi:hypothetical protein